MPVSIGIGSTRIITSVTIVIGVEVRYSVMIGMHFAGSLCTLKVLLTGRHWKILRSVKTNPPALTNISAAYEIIRKSLFVTLDSRK